MTAVLLWIGCAALAAAVTARTTRHLAVSAPLRALNYRGLSVPTAAGFAILFGILSALGLTGLLFSLFHTHRLNEATGQTLFFVLISGGFALLGLWDDVAGTAGERGWRAHIDAIRHGRATAGAIKLVGGATLAFGITASAGQSFGWSLIGAATIAMSANAFNLLDVRPGRSCKFFVVAVVVLIFVPGVLAVAPLVAGLGAALAFLPFDLRERAMLGDTGSMALGAFVGWGIVLTGHTADIIAIAVFAILHVFSDKPGLSAIIDAVPPLRAFDRAGRVAE